MAFATGGVAPGAFAVPALTGARARAPKRISPAVTEARRRHHSEMEKLYRSEVNKCLDELRELVPGCRTEDSKVLNKAEVLQRTVEYIKQMQNGEILPRPPSAAPLSVDESASPSELSFSAGPVRTPRKTRTVRSGKRKLVDENMDDDDSLSFATSLSVSPSKLSRAESSQPDDTTVAQLQQLQALQAALSVPSLPTVNTTIPAGLPAVLPVHYFDPTSGQVLVMEYSPSTPRTAVQSAPTNYDTLLQELAVPQHLDPNMLAPKMAFRPSLSEADLTRAHPTARKEQQQMRTMAPQLNMPPPGASFMRSISVPANLAAARERFDPVESFEALEEESSFFQLDHGEITDGEDDHGVFYTVGDHDQ